MAFPEDIIEDNNGNNITQKFIAESEILDFTDNMVHLPIINSIMKGNDEPFPLSKNRNIRNKCLLCKNFSFVICFN